MYVIARLEAIIYLLHLKSLLLDCFHLLLKKAQNELNQFVQSFAVDIRAFAYGEKSVN